MKILVSFCSIGEPQKFAPPHPMSDGSHKELSGLGLKHAKACSLADRPLLKIDNHITTSSHLLDMHGYAELC